MTENGHGNTGRTVTAGKHFIFICTVTLAFVSVLWLIACLSGCVRYEPAIAGTPTPTASPTPLPEPFYAEVTEQPYTTDRLGLTIETEDHYYRHYLSFGDLRVYEYETGTFLDGVVVNAFPETLEGEVYIVFRDADGTVVGRGKLHLADGSTALPTGTSNIYAEIVTDITVQDTDFSLEVEKPFVPTGE